MIKLFLALSLLSVSALAYVPPVESLLRHGANPDITANGVSVTFKVIKLGVDEKAKDSSLVSEGKAGDFYKMFFTKVNSEVMKVAQTRYSNSSFSEDSLIEKNYISNFSSYTIKSSDEETEKGIFHGMLRSILFNDGSFLIEYLKTLNVPVKLNSEIINRQKVEYLADYKQYLTAINKDRTAKKTEKNPLKPDDASQREKVDRVMNEPMYVDQKQVKVSRENGEMSWLIHAGNFEAVVSYKNREIERIKYKSATGEFDIICRDYWLANGTHGMPKTILVKDFKGDNYQIEVTNLRHYLEKDVDLVNRLKKWDSILKGKGDHTHKPSFLL